MRRSHLARLSLLVALLATFTAASAQTAASCTQCAEWNVSQEPFRVYGNTYYVGVHGLSSILITSPQGHVLIDVRSPELYARGHVPGAVNIPHGKIIESRLAQYGSDTVFVVYCAGPHCNGAHKGAIRLARLGRPVKLMIGGITGWLDEGFELATS